MAQLKSRLGEKIADKALAIASNDQDKILKSKKKYLLWKTKYQIMIY